MGLHKEYIASNYILVRSTVRDYATSFGTESWISFGAYDLASVFGQFSKQDLARVDSPGSVFLEQHSAASPTTFTSEKSPESGQQDLGIPSL